MRELVLGGARSSGAQRAEEVDERPLGVAALFGLVIEGHAEHIFVRLIVACHLGEDQPPREVRVAAARPPFRVDPRG